MHCIFDAIMALSNNGVWFMHEVYCFLTMYFFIIWLSFKVEPEQERKKNIYAVVVVVFFPTDNEVDKKCYGRHHLNGMKQLLNLIHKCRFRQRVSVFKQPLAHIHTKKSQRQKTDMRREWEREKKSGHKNNYGSVL